MLRVLLLYSSACIIIVACYTILINAILYNCYILRLCLNLISIDGRVRKYSNAGYIIEVPGLPHFVCQEANFIFKRLASYIICIIKTH